MFMRTGSGGAADGDQKNDPENNRYKNKPFDLLKLINFLIP
jgi:hypothetical protein